MPTELPMQPPIIIEPYGPRCLSGWLSSVQHLVGGRCVPAREAQQRLEGRHRRVSAVEPEHELVDVGRQVLRAHPVVGPLQPGLQVREGPVDAREQLGRVPRVPYGRRPVVVALAQRGVPLPAVRQHGAARIDRGLDERHRRGRGEVPDHRQPDAARAPAAPTTIDLPLSRRRPPRRPSSRPPTYASSTSTTPERRSRSGRSIARRSLCSIVQAVSYPPRPSWRWSWTAENPRVGGGTRYAAANQ